MLATRKTSKSNSPFVLRIKKEKRPAQYNVLNASINNDKGSNAVHIKKFWNSQIANTSILELKSSTVLLAYEVLE